MWKKTFIDRRVPISKITYAQVGRFERPKPGFLKKPERKQNALIIWKIDKIDKNSIKPN